MKRFGMLSLVIMICIITSAGSSFGMSRPSESIEGSWEGAIETPDGNSVRVLFHVRKADDGGLVGHAESPDQTDEIIPVEKVSVEDGVVVFEIAIIEGVYKGTLEKGNRKIAGEWSQGGAAMTLVLTKMETEEKADEVPENKQAIVLKSADYDKIHGTWKGMFPAGGQNIVFEFDVYNNAEGELHAFLVIPAQGSDIIPLMEYGYDNGILRFIIAPGRGEFEGKMAGDSLSIKGEWKQGGQAIPLTLAR